MTRWSLLLALLLIAAAAIASGIYKWIDDQGITHYSDAPPKAQKATQLDHPAEPPPAAPDNAARQPAEDWAQKEQEFRKRQKVRQEQLDEDIKKSQRAAEIAEIQQGARTPVPGGTAAGLDMQRVVQEWIVRMDSQRDSTCNNHRIIHTEVAERYRHARTAVEYWTLDRCGKPVRYRVTITWDAKGHANALVERDDKSP